MTTQKPTDRLARVRELARRLDELEAERVSVDKRIAALTRELEGLLGQRIGTGLPVSGVAAEAGNQKDDSASGTFADRAMEMLSQNSKVSYAELATVLYGDATEGSKNKARSVLYFLQKRGRIQGEAGNWRVLPNE